MHDQSCNSQILNEPLRTARRAVIEAMQRRERQFGCGCGTGRTELTASAWPELRS